MSGISKFLMAAILAATITPAVAQDGGGMGKMMGSHSMAATVTNVDSQTGMMDVDAGGHALKLHFPPASLSDVKSGDKITIRMSFSKSGM
jgi:hypothetical protein